MNVERWQQIDKIFQAAVELPPERRAAFLDEACKQDQVLRSKVESMLASDEHEWELIEKPAFEVAAPLLADDQPRLAPGQHIGHYEIVSLLGKGGMGEVYLAKDERLNRRIALKLLPADYTRDEDRLRRFEQEAQAASALNHPNILTIHEIGQIDDLQFIATEFVEGETLRHRTRRGPLSLHEALDVMIQVCAALAAAHKAGIVHRDIKPENIMLRRDGYVKVVDFGLAKLTEQSSTADIDRSVQKIDTMAGMVMGTTKYMSPEQARGLDVDARSDVFSSGALLYELVTNHVPFEGETSSDLIAAILKEDPLPLSHYSPGTPDELQDIVSKTLRKNRKERYNAVEDLRVDLKALKDQLELESRLQSSGYPGALRDATTTTGVRAASTAERSAQSTASSAEYVVRKIRHHKAGALIMLGVLFISTVAIGYVVYNLSARSRTGSSDNIKLARVTTSGKAANAAISPDGKYVAYVTNDAGQQSLWIRQVAANSNVQIVPPGPVAFWGLTFSPEGNYLYYFGSSKDEPDPSLYQMPALGGVSTKLITGVVNTSGDSPVSFSPDGKRMTFVREYPSGETAVVTASADGTGEQKLASRSNPAFYVSAAWSPDGRRVACVVGSSDNKGPYAEVVAIGVHDGLGGPISNRRWRWISNLVFLSDDELLITASEQEGNPIQIWDIALSSGKTRRISTDLNNYAGLSLTADSSALVTTQNDKVMNIWTQPDGDPQSAKQITSGTATKDGWDGISWTPDGKIVYSSHASGNADIWIMEADGSNPKQLTVDLGSDNFGLSVSPDGLYIVFVSHRSDIAHIWRVNIDGSNPRQLTRGDGEFNPFCSADSRWVFYLRNGKQWKVPIDGGDSQPLTASYSDLVAISPDGNLAAYLTSDDQTKRKIGIVSSAGGEPITTLDIPTPIPRRIEWAPDGKALTYINNRAGASNIWSQPITGGPPKQLTDFKTHFINCFSWSRDGNQLACARWKSTSDVVMIKNFR